MDLFVVHAGDVLKLFLTCCVPHKHPHILRLLHLALLNTSLRFQLHGLHLKIPGQRGHSPVIVDKHIVDESLNNRSLADHGVPNKDDLELFRFIRQWPPI